VPAYSDLLEEFCAALDLGDEVTVVGNSMGGYIAADLATRRPSWLKRLVLVSPAGVLHARLNPTVAVALASAAALTAKVGHHYRRASLTRPRLRRMAFGEVFHYPELLRMELLWEFMSHAVEAPGFLSAVRAMVTYEGFLDRLPEIEAPTLIVWGRNDHVVFAHDAPDWERLIEGLELHVYARTGHCAMAERPVRFNRELEAFLQTT
ncbi:MAG: alpha/beta fold hydrolase, partial [Solirubrobacterales bacterium]